MSRLTPTARTLRALRAQGWVAEKVEQRLPIPGRHVTRDMAGFADGIAWKPGAGILAWNATSAPNVAAHVAKYHSNCEPKLRHWLLAGGQFQIWGWGLKGARGALKTWQARRIGFGVDAAGRLCDFELREVP